MTAAQKYYANSNNPISYRSHDYEIAAQYRALPPALQERFDVSITGIDPTDASTIAKDMDNRLRAHPGVFMAVGETTLIKEIISDKNPHRPVINSKATQTLLMSATARGLPVILHCDRGVPGNKDKNAELVLKEINKWIDKAEWSGSDPLKGKPGLENVPQMKPKIVWAHGAGISRFTAESKDHTRKLDTMLSDDKLKDALSIDLSWDFVGHDMMENMHDQLKRAGVAPGIQQGLQNSLKLYKAFTEAGNASDKADDLGDLNLAAVHRQSAEGIAEKYFASLADFKVRVTAAFNDPATVTAFQRFTTDHGNQGNNWFHIFSKHQDRMLFGTDALSVGTKAHGDASYAMNTRVLYPVYEMFEQLAARTGDAALKDISQKVRTGNYDKVFHDPEVKLRRDAYETMLLSERPADHSTNARPQDFVETPEQADLRRRNGFVAES